MGNTNTVFAIASNSQINHIWRINTNINRTSDEYAVWLLKLLEIEELSLKISLVALNGSTLVVHVNDPAWSSQISWLETQILERIDEKIGKNVVTAVKAKTIIPKKTV